MRSRRRGATRWWAARCAVLVDEPGVARSHREAPEIDGVVVVPTSLEVGEFHDVVVKDALGPGRGGGVVVTGETLDPPSERTFVYGPGAILTPANAVTLLRVGVRPGRVRDDAPATRTSRRGRWSPSGSCCRPATCSTARWRGATAPRGRARSSTRSPTRCSRIGGVGIMCWENRFPWVALVLIVVREIAISGFRAVYVRRGLAVPASKLAKWKTFLQLGAVGWVTLPLTTNLGWLSNTTLWLGVGVGLVSGAQYLIAGSRGATSMAR